MSTPTEFDEMIRRLREMMTRMQEQGTSNPLVDILASFLSFFLNIDDDTDAPDFEDITDPAERAAAEREYRGREAAERARHGDFRESARRWTAVNVATSSAELLEMRREAEAANGGQRLRAIHPVEGESRRTSNYGMRTHPISGVERMHAGVDFAGEHRGDKPHILSTMPGIVIGVGVRGRYGNMVEILDIYGVKHRYAHLDSSSVHVGQQVQQGERIGVMGTTGASTGVHLHYEQRDANNQARDPLPHIDAHGHAVRPHAPAATPATSPATTPQRTRTRETPRTERHTLSIPDVKLPQGLVRLREQAEDVAGDLIEDGQRRVANLSRSLTVGLGNLFQR